MRGYPLHSLQAEPTVNIDKLQGVLKREQKRIEALGIWRQQQHIQRRITGFLVPPGLPHPPPSLLEILVPPSTLICLFMLLLYLSTIPQPVLLLADLIPYFHIFSIYKNILVISIPHPVPTICLYREYAVVYFYLQYLQHANMSNYPMYMIKPFLRRVASNTSCLYGIELLLYLLKPSSHLNDPVRHCHLLLPRQYPWSHRPPYHPSETSLSTSPTGQ